MASLGCVITEAIVHHYGRDEFLRRLSHPFWFQSFGAVMGMDWHSSGITTSVLGALKRGLGPKSKELGLHVCGGRGRQSRKTPDELRALGDGVGLDATSLVHASKLVAKVDSAAVQDGFELYLHGFIVTDDGKWAVVQQGMNTDSRQARRYHWLSEDVRSFVDEPHAAIDGRPRGEIINLTDRRAHAARAAQVELINAGPDAVVRELEKLQRTKAEPASAQLPLLSLPEHHEVRSSDVVLRRLHGALAAAADRGPVDFEDVLMTPGVGARTIEAVALVAEVVHGAPSRFSDPARYSYAHGGKDGHPFPVPLEVYDETIRVMRDAVAKAKLGNADRLAAIATLDEEARRLEQTVTGPDWETIVAREGQLSPGYGGRSVFGPAERKPADAAPNGSKPARRQVV